MEKTKRYAQTVFSPETLRSAIELFRSTIGRKKTSHTYSIQNGPEEWKYDDETEFFADYHRQFNDYSFWERAEHGSFVVNCYFNPQGFHTYTTVNVKAKTRSEIEKVFNVFEDDHESAKSATISRFSQAEPVVFVGHGQSPIWKELKDHLHEKHGYNVQAYEIGARAGLTIQNILEDMLESASFAVLVMTR